MTVTRNHAQELNNISAANARIFKTFMRIYRQVCGGKNFRSRPISDKIRQ